MIDHNDNIKEPEKEDSSNSDSDYDNSKTPTQTTPQSHEDLTSAISKIAPVLVSIARDLNQVSNKLDPIRREIYYTDEESGTRIKIEINCDGTLPGLLLLLLFLISKRITNIFFNI